MIKPKYPRSGSHELEAMDEFEILVTGFCIPGHAPITNRAPEDCDPGDPGEIEEFAVYIVNGNSKINITPILTKAQREYWEDSLMEDYLDYEKAYAEGEI